MGTIVTYNGNQSDPVKRNTAYLPTAGKYMTGDITITDTGMDSDDCVYQDKDGFIVLNDSYGTYVDKETLEITENGTYTAPERKVWNALDVKVPSSELFKSIVDRTITEIRAEDLEGIETITAHAFRYCDHLISANMPSVTSIGNYSFSGCTALTNVYCPNVATLDQFAFHQCSSLTSIVCSNNLTSIKNACFQGCEELSGFDFSNITDVTASSFQGTKITELNTATLTLINGNRAFSDCTSLTKINLPNVTGFTTSQNYVFSNCISLTRVNIPKVTALSIYLFDGCSSLPILDLPLVDSIRAYAFRNCSSLATIILRNTSAVVTLDVKAFDGNTPFASTGTGGTLYVPSALIESYQTETNWSAILSYENNQILPIEGSQYENYYADGTPIT